MMEEDEDIVKPSAAYLARILAGVLLLGAGVLASFLLPLLEKESSRWLALGGLLLAAVGLVPIVRFFYRRSDEFHQSLHRQACAIALPVLFSIFTVVGILQANQLLPTFNAYWAMLLVLVVWAFSLMLSDRRYRA